MPLLSRNFTALCGTLSAHGPVAFTIARTRLWCAVEVRRSSTWQNHSAPLRREMRRDLVHGFLFHAGFVHQPDAALLKIAQSAVQETTRSAAGAGGEVMLIDESYSQSAHGRVARDAAADDAAADHE